MNKSKGTFWSTPKDMSDESTYIYWQQAHAMDVVIYSYKRIKDTNKQLAATYRTYFERWYANHANNYHRNPSDETGFLNDFTDDMCWICLTLIHLSEATGDENLRKPLKLYTTNTLLLEHGQMIKVRDFHGIPPKTTVMLALILRVVW